MRALVIAACLVIGASAFAAPVGSVVVIDRSVAHVNGAVIWESELAARAASADPKDKPAVLEEMITEELVIGEARRAGITVDKSEVMAALGEIKSQNKLDDAGLDAALEQAGYTRARYLVDLERQLLALRAKNQFVSPRIDVTDADVEAEAKERKLAVPVKDPEKSTIQRELRRKAFDAQEVIWIADLRRRAWIERRK